MTGAVIWYLWIVAAGLVVFPFAWWVMRFLPDRGWTLSKAFGLLLWGYGLWMGASLGVLPNQAGGWLVSLLLLAGLSAWVMRKGGWNELRAWLKTRWQVILTAETLFLVAFTFWSVVRAANPDLSSTEKPMELAFINAILRSPTFPPHDPWLAGYGISYYYFGYVIMAMLSGLSGVSGTVGFSLGVATCFGLGAVGIYGVVYNLLAVEPRRKSAHFGALLAPLFLLLLGNFEGPLELLHNSGAFWKTQSNGQIDSEFWRWLDIKDLKEPPAETFSFWEANGRRNWWWWRASRVISDYDASAGWEAVTDPGITGGWREVIDEFPAFSFALGDLHPHVLSIPYVLLAIGLAFNRYRREMEEETGPQGWRQWLKQPELWILAVCLGGLSFLNTWDFPIYVALTAAAYGLARLQRQGWGIQPLMKAGLYGLVIGLAGIALYLPFYLGFASQAGGILPSLSFYSRGVHWWVMFGVLLIPILFWLVSMWRSSLDRKNIKVGLSVAAILVGGLWLLSYAWGALMLVLPEQGNLLMGIQSSNDAGSILLPSFLRRLAQPGTWLSQLVLLAMVTALLWREGKKSDQRADASISRPEAFVLLLVLLGLGLTLFPEFFYLRDQFGWRMNTIFKFYYQTWILWAAAAAYASVWLWESLPGWQRALMRLGWVAVVAGGLVYPFFAFLDRANGFQPAVWTLDGAVLRAQVQPYEMEAIAWLQKAPTGVIVEAVGGSYSAYARVSTYSGLPAVLGWPGHEGQWRGGYREVGTRQEDIDTLYSARRWEDADAVLVRYNIRYVYVGDLELSTYAVVEDKFMNHMELVFQNDGVRIYERVLP